MAFPVWLDNLIAYSLQIAILAAAGTLLAYVFRLRVPRVSLVYWQALLIVCLLLPALQNWKHPVVAPGYAVSETAYYMISTTVSPAHPKPSICVAPDIIALIFAVGIIARLLWLVLGFFRLRIFLRRSISLSTIASDPLAVSSQIRVRARFFISDEVDSPATFGIVEANVILPRSFSEMSEACREAIICHELLHVRRRDWAIILAEEIIRSIFWFHPAVWWLLGRIHLSREQWIDCEVVRLTGNRQPYLDSLLEIAQSRGRPKAVPAPLFLREHHLVQRVTLLLKEASMNRWRLVFSLAIIILLLAGTVRVASAWFPLMGESVLVRGQAANPAHATQKPDSIKLDDNLQNAKSINEGSPVVPGTSPQKTEKPSLLPLAGAPVLAQTTIPSPDNALPVRAPIRVGGNVQNAKLIEKVDPEYPELAKRARISGFVDLTVTVDEQGYVSDIRVVRGHPLLNDAAISAVKKWRYSPTLLNGQPVPVIATVRINFSPEEVTGSLALPPAQNVNGNGRPGRVQYVATIYRDPVFGDISIDMSASTAGESGQISGAAFFPPQFAFDIERLHSLMKAGGWDSVPTEEVSPSGMVFAGAPGAVYTFALSDAGEISKVQRIRGIDITGMEQALAHTRVIASGRLGANHISMNCTISFLPVNPKTRF
jgi:TonB family protein